MRRKYLLNILSIVLLVLGLFGPGYATDFQIENFLIRTITDENGDFTTRFGFEIRDNYDRLIWEDVVQTAMVTDPNGNMISSACVLDEWRFTEWMQIDKNGNGIIEPELGEWQNQIRYSNEYRIYDPGTTHSAGTYNLNVTLKDGQMLSKSNTVTAGVKLPHISDVAAEFNSEGQLVVSWVPASVYPEDSKVDLRLNFFERDGSPKYDRYRARFLPTTSTSHTLDQYWSDYIRSKAAIVQVSIWIWSGDRNSRAESAMKFYGIDKDNNIAKSILNPEPCLLSEEEVDELVAETCPGNSENHGRPDSPGNSNHLGLMK